MPLWGLAPYWQGQGRRWVVGLGALMVTHLIETGIPWQLQRGLDRIAQGDRNLAGPALAIVGLTVLRNLCMAFGRRTNAQASVHIAMRLRLALYAHLQTLDRHFHIGQSVGDLMARQTADVETVRRFFRFAFNQIIALTAISLVAPVFMWQLSPALTLAIVPWLALTAAGGAWFAVRIRLQSTRAQEANGTLTEGVLQSLQGIRTIQAYAQESREVDHLDALGGQHARANTRLNTLQSGMTAFMLAMTVGLTLVVAALGGHAVLQRTLSVGTLGAFLFYLGLVAGAYGRCSAPVFAYLSAATATERILAVLRTPPALTDGTHGVAGIAAGRVSLHHVTWQPDGARSPVLDGVSLALPVGQLIALMGPTGCGKSSLLRLIARVMDPTAGHVNLDGIDVRQWSLAQLRAQVTLVTQDSHLFAASVHDNIAYDLPQRATSEVQAAAQRAQLGPTLATWPQGLGTTVGERGVTLSGGQRQRVMLGRGDIRHTPVLLLDDTLSALDNTTESVVLQDLRRQRLGHTTVIATHRIGAARQADLVVLMDRGRVLVTGTHDQLLATQPLYRKLCNDADTEYAARHAERA